MLSVCGRGGLWATNIRLVRPWPFDELAREHLQCPYRGGACRRGEVVSTTMVELGTGLAIAATAFMPFPGMSMSMSARSGFVVTAAATAEVVSSASATMTKPAGSRALRMPARNAASESPIRIETGCEAASESLLLAYSEDRSL